MISTKNMCTLTITLALSVLSLHAKSEKRETLNFKKLNPIAIETNNKSIICSAQPLTKLEAKELFGSTGPMDNLPTDIFRYDAYGRTYLSNGFTNLHCRYSALEITIKNNSVFAIIIPKVEVSGENYIQTPMFTFEPKHEILSRYPTTGMVLKGFMAGTIGLFGLLSAFCFAEEFKLYSNNSYTEENPKGVPTTVGIIFTGVTVSMAMKLNKYLNINENLDNLQEHFRLINDENLENDENEDHITIPAGATFKDILFINNAKYFNVIERMNSFDAPSKLIYEIVK